MIEYRMIQLVDTNTEHEVEFFTVYAFPTDTDYEYLIHNVPLNYVLYEFGDPHPDLPQDLFYCKSSGHPDGEGDIGWFAYVHKGYAMGLYPGYYCWPHITEHRIDFIDSSFKLYDPIDHEVMLT